MFMFFTVLAVYVVACVYLAVRVSGIFRSRCARVAVRSVVGVLSSLFFVGRMVAHVAPVWLNGLIYVVGTSWLVVVLYGVLVMLALELSRYLARLRKMELRPWSKATLVSVAALVATVLGVGIYSAFNTVEVHYTVRSPRVAVGDTVTVALVSDLHLGYAVGRSDMQRLVDKVNAAGADVCIIAGDMFDADVRPVLEGDLGRPLSKLGMPVYAVMGNHDYMGNSQQVVDYMHAVGVQMLIDSAVSCCGLTIVGRDDLCPTRMKLPDIVPSGASNVVVVDHQPAAIDESVECRALLHLSGHTHAGQVWPMRMFTKNMYKTDYGCRAFGATTVVTTSGFGTWGPRVRLGSLSEVVFIHIVR